MTPQQLRAAVTDPSPNEGHRESKISLPPHHCVCPQFPLISCLPTGAHLTNPTHKAWLCWMWDVCSFPQCQNATVQIKSQYTAQTNTICLTNNGYLQNMSRQRIIKQELGTVVEIPGWDPVSYISLFKVTLIKRTARHWKMAILAEGVRRWEAALSWKVCESHFCDY